MRESENTGFERTEPTETTVTEVSDQTSVTESTEPSESREQNVQESEAGKEASETEAEEGVREDAELAGDSVVHEETVSSTKEQDVTEGEKNGVGEYSYDDPEFQEYLSDVESITGFSLTEEQRESIQEAMQENHFEKLSPIETKIQRAEFDGKKAELREEWEIKTGQKWPTYEGDVVSKNGKVVRYAGQPYDAHHIIENSYGGPAKWWNITPARFPDQHQEGIHKTESANKIYGE